MSPDTEKRVLSTIYDSISSAITYTPPGNLPPVTDRKVTFLQLASNFAINPGDFDNAVNPGNPNGDLSKAENFSRLVDAQPEVQNSYVAQAGKSVDQTYGGIIRGANATEMPDPVQAARYEEAHSFLYTRIRGSGGRWTTVESEPYAHYLDTRQNYADAIVAYRTANINLDMTKPADQRKWTAIEPALRNKVTTAYNRWKTADAGKVENAISVMGTSINSMIRAVLQQSKEEYENSSKASLLGDPVPWHLTYATPGNWYAPELSPNLSELTIGSDRLNTSASSEFTSWGGGASWNAGLWSVGGGVSGSSSDVRSHMDSDHFKLNFKFGVVQIRRPWMNSSLFQKNGWSLGAAVPRGGVSEGKLVGAEAKLMPLVPTAFIIVRDVSIEAEWKAEDYRQVQESISGHASVGWGPFQFSGSYSRSTSNTTFNSSLDGGTLKVPGVQIIAMISSIIPYSPPQ